MQTTTQRIAASANNLWSQVKGVDLLLPINMFSRCVVTAEVLQACVAAGLPCLLVKPHGKVDDVLNSHGTSNQTPFV